MVEILNYKPENKLNLVWIRDRLPKSRVVTVLERRSRNTKISISPVDDSWKKRAKALGHKV